jgi:hypothetical protein
VRARGILPVLLAVLPAACLEVKSQDPPMCKVTDDCNAGEVCDEGVCWGNPPDGMFAAVVTPPSERADLVSREVLMLPISDDGWMEEIHLDNAVAFQGRLQAVCGSACDGRTLTGTMTITRPSVFNGGPGFRKVVTIDDGTFELAVPATRPDESYTITVVPGDRDVPGAVRSLAQLVPPFQLRQPIDKDITGNVFELSTTGLPTISGYVATMGNLGLGGYRVVALGRWAPDQPLTEVSTVDFTGTSTGGRYSITLSRGVLDPIEIVARPYTSQLLPELHLTAQLAGGGSAGLTLPAATTGIEVPVDVIVDHKETGGEIARVAGARVRIAGSYADLNSTTNASMRFSAEGTTNEDGVVHLRLLDGLPLSYGLSIIPPPGSKAAALFEKAYAIQGTTQVRLGTRIAITGVLLGADDLPVQDVSVTARPSVRFLWSLEPGPQAFLGAIPTATVVTPNTGEFVLFVDHALSNTSGQATTVWGHYDLTFEPTMKSRAPSWTRTDVELPRDDAQSTVALGDVHLPDAAHVRGVVFDDQNAHLAGAEVKLYQVQTDLAVCQETRFEPLSCPVPPLLLGRGASDKDGVVRLTLPR